MRLDVGERLGDVRVADATAEIWIARVPAHVGDVDAMAASVLSPPERTRAAGYRDTEAAARYVITRSLVRGVLAQRLDVPPQRVDVRVTDLGKPVVSDDLHFNVSHSGDVIVLAVSAERAVGIDVERKRPVKRVGALIARWLTPPERAEVVALKGRGLDESDAFLRVWSLKEARLKALGVGISASTNADVARTTAMPLDDLLARRADEYVGAVAFA